MHTEIVGCKYLAIKVGGNVVDGNLSKQGIGAGYAEGEALRGELFSNLIDDLLCGSIYVYVDNITSVIEQTGDVDLCAFRNVGIKYEFLVRKCRLGLSGICSIIVADYPNVALRLACLKVHGNAVTVAIELGLPCDINVGVRYHFHINSSTVAANGEYCVSAGGSIVYTCADRLFMACRNVIKHGSTVVNVY